MKTASIAELKARLSEFLAGVGAGDVIITDRGRPVARLSALEPDYAEGRLAELARQGLVRPPRSRARGCEIQAGDVVDDDARLLKALLDERESGR
ncbi:MAG: type II toxin-antitoxin system prevent-host-death family antitoxin [Gemmatimonadota bacterium]